jgi:hypothetical protein
MRRFVCVLSTVVLAASPLLAQDGPPPGGGGPGGGGRGPGGGFSRPNLVFDAIDADADGSISEEELANAATALKKLDKDNDGKITREEARPPQGQGGPGGGGFGGGFGGGGGGFGGGREFDPEEFAAGLIERDADADGKLTAEELGGFGSRLIEGNDKDGDGALNIDEVRAAAEAMKARFESGDFGGGGRGRGGDRGGRPEGDGDRGGRPDDDDGDRGGRPDSDDDGEDRA